MSPAPQPLWRQVFDRTERTVARPLEGLVASNRYVGVALWRQRFRGAVAEAIERPTAAFLHLLNLPARSDIRRLGHQISALTNEVRELAAGVEEFRAPEPAPTNGKPRAAAKAAPRTRGDA
jgi:hypothetical protein